MPPTRKIWLALAQILAARQIKILPDILAGERTPKMHEKIVLMQSDGGGAIPSNAPATPNNQAQPKIVLAIDEAKLAALRQEDQILAAMLTPIFSDHDAAAPPLASTEGENATKATAKNHKNQKNQKNLLGLDDAHAKFAEILLSRQAWSRGEALQMAKKCHLMLDGALERINDAAFDQYSASLYEGDDPIGINQEVKESLEHDHNVT